MVAAIATVVTAGSVQVLQASGASAGGDALPRQAAIGVGIVTLLASLLLIPCINHHQRAGRALYRAWADRPGVTLDKHCGEPARRDEATDDRSAGAPASVTPATAFGALTDQERAASRRWLFLPAVCLLLLVMAATWWLLGEVLDRTNLAVVLGGGTGILVGVALVITFLRIDPERVTPAYHGCDGCCYEAHLNACELGITSVPQQPVNTYSNLPFAMGGVLVGLYFSTPTSYVFMFAMLVLTIGSCLYHGLSTKWSGHLDVIGIYWVFVALCFFAWGRQLGVGEALIAAPMLVLAMLLAPFLRIILKKVDIYWKVGVILLLTYIPAFLVAERAGYAEGTALLWWSVASFALAIGLWLLDRFVLRVKPGQNTFNVGVLKLGHGLWHILAAIATTILFAVPAAAVPAAGVW